MGTDVAEVEKTPDSFCDAKVHRAMCTQLRTLLDGILEIFPDIEAARPRCMSGVQALCHLRCAIDKTELLLQNCRESSRFYLTLTGGAVVMRFENTRKQLQQSLNELKNMVPPTLELKISELVNDLRGVIFNIDSYEQKAGKVLQALLQKEESILSSFGNSEIRALQFVASRIHLTLQKDLLIEKTSIMNMLGKVSDSERTKKATLRYLHHLLEKHDKLLLEGQTFTDRDRSLSSVPSTRSVNGHSVDMRPRLRYTEDESTPQTSAFGSSDISSDSISSCGSLAGLQLRIDLSSLSLGSVDGSNTSFASDDLGVDNSSPEFKFFSCRREIEATLLSKISQFPWESQRTAIEDVQNYLDYYTYARVPISANNFVEPLAGFLKDAVNGQDLRAQIAGTRLFLTGLRARRSVIRCINQDVYRLLTSFLGTTMTKDVLAILELSAERSCGMKLAESGALTSILRILDTQNKEFHEIAVKILYNLSLYEDPCPLKCLPLECIPKLVPLLGDNSLAGHCIVILDKLFCMEEAQILAVETEGFAAAIVDLLKTENCEEQEHGLSVLLSLCSRYDECCESVMEEGIIPTLVHIQINGNDTGKESASKLLQLLRMVIDEDEQEGFIV